MKATPQRAREACEFCRKSRKRCEFDGLSGCSRCVRRGIPCSLFPPEEVTAAAHPGPSVSVATESATALWDKTTHNPVPLDLSYSTPPQGNFYWGLLVADAVGEQYPADIINQTPLANEDQSEQPAMAQDGAYDQNVFNDHDGA